MNREKTNLENEKPALSKGDVMPRFCFNEDYYLSRYKIGEDKEKIVFEFPIGVHIDLYANRDFLLRQFKDVQIDITYPRTQIQKVTCFKK